MPKDDKGTKRDRSPKAPRPPDQREEIARLCAIHISNQKPELSQKVFDMANKGMTWSAIVMWMAEKLCG